MILKPTTLRGQFMLTLVVAELVWVSAAIAIGVVALQLHHQDTHEAEVLEFQGSIRDQFDGLRQVQSGLQEIALGNHTTGYATLVDARTGLLQEDDKAIDTHTLPPEQIEALATVKADLLDFADQVLAAVETIEAASTPQEYAQSRNRLESLLASVTSVIESAELLFADITDQLRLHREVDEGHERNLRMALGGVLAVSVPLALLLPFLLLVRVARRFASGVEHLSDSVRAVAEGDLARRANREGGDELADLADNFNAMAEKLEDSTNHLNQAVRERTEELRNAMVLLSHRNRELEDFTYAASHDLREPLRTIVGFGELLELDLPEDAPREVREELAAILAAGRRMQALVSDLLDLSRSARQKLEPQTCDMNLLAREVLSNLAVVIDESGAQVTLDALPMMQVDPFLFGRVLQNLVSNAIKYQPKGRLPLVHISARVAGDACELVVADNGIGIAPEYHDRIFHAFKRLHRQDEYEGSGIGLAVCRRTVERHGGSIRVESTPGEGSRFIVTIPAKPPSSISSAALPAVPVDASGTPPSGVWDPLPAESGRAKTDKTTARRRTKRRYAIPPVNRPEGAPIHG